MAKSKNSLKKYVSGFLWIAVIAAVVYLILRNISVSSNILQAVIGLGLVVLVHEFGHFIACKLVGIKVEAFSIFMPPILVGVRKTAKGFRFRVLPKFLAKEEQRGDDTVSTAGGKKGEAEETEYRVGLIPFGGFVKMLGQDDIGPVKSSDDPRSYANKPVGARMAVISAGVVFNILSAVIIFMIAFLIGIKLPPAVIGGVIPNSPAARAGLRAGDEVIEINGKNGVFDFSNIAMAAALSDANEAVALKVRHEDGSKEDFAIVAEQLPGDRLKSFGEVPPISLTIAKVSEPNALLEETGLLPGDKIVSVEGRDVKARWELAEIVENTLAPEVTIAAKRKDELIKSQIGLDLIHADTYDVNSESELYHIYSMVPRLRITTVLEESASITDRIISLFNKVLIKVGIKKKTGDSKPKLKKGDIILTMGEVENPTYKEMRDVVTEYEGRELPIRVLRKDANGAEEVLTVTVMPRRSRGGERVIIGIDVVLDAEHPVVAKSIDTGGEPGKLAIPRGASITTVDGTVVSNWYDIIREISKYPGERITIDWRVDAEVAGDIALNVRAGREFVTVKSTISESILLEPLEKLYRASGPIDAVVMGFRKTVMFVAQTYATLKSLISRTVELENVMGPVGIVTFGYVAAQRPFTYQLYLFGLVSACIAVINFLPLLPFDGGHIVFLLIEKIKGSAVNERVQTAILQVGWVLVILLILYVTFNDIARIFRMFY